MQHNVNISIDRYTDDDALDVLLTDLTGEAADLLTTDHTLTKDFDMKHNNTPERAELEKFLAPLFNEQEVIDYLQLVVGNAVAGRPAGYIYTLMGDGYSGKSALLSLIERTVDEDERGGLPNMPLTTKGDRRYVYRQFQTRKIILAPYYSLHLKSTTWREKFISPVIGGNESIRNLEEAPNVGTLFIEENRPKPVPQTKADAWDHVRVFWFENEFEHSSVPPVPGSKVFSPNHNYSLQSISELPEGHPLIVGVREWAQEGVELLKARDWKFPDEPKSLVAWREKARNISTRRSGK